MNPPANVHSKASSFAAAVRNPTICNSSSSSSCFSSSSSSVVPKDAKHSSSLSKETTTSSDGVVAIPIDFDVAARVEGQESQIVTVDLEPGQVLRAESGAMLYMTQGVSMETTTGGGLSSGFKRMLTGQNIFISDFRYDGPPQSIGTVALGTDFPSKILRLNVAEYGGKIICQKGALLCASHTIDIEVEMAKKFTAGFFGGEGFILQSLTGSGDVFVKAGGTLVTKELGEGEVLRVSSGCLVGFTEGVEFDVQMMPGFKNVMFGGEGLFVTTLTGPGIVWLQGMPPDRMISEIARRVPSGGGIGLGLPIGMGAGGGGEGAEGGDASAEGAGDAAAEDMTSVSATDTAVVGGTGAGFDGNTTSFASSSDAESPEALFGDAAAVTPSMGGFNDDSDFENDVTTGDRDEFSDFEPDQTSFDTEADESLMDDDLAEEGKTILSTIWNVFKDD